jgi:hypothetical protein
MKGAARYTHSNPCVSVVTDQNSLRYCSRAIGAVGNEMSGVWHVADICWRRRCANRWPGATEPRELTRVTSEQSQNTLVPRDTLSDPAASNCSLFHKLQMCPHYLRLGCPHSNSFLVCRDVSKSLSRSASPPLARWVTIKRPYDDVID